MTHNPEALDERAQFEEWCEQHQIETEKHRAEYTHVRTHACWLAWQARAALPADKTDAVCVRTAIDAERLARQQAEAETERQRDRAEAAEKALDFVALWAWRKDPPSAGANLTDAERLSAIKHHPAIRARGCQS